MRSATTTLQVTPAGRLDVVDVTEDLERAVKDSGVTEGCAVAFCAHTTCTLVLGEFEDGLLEDFRKRLDALAPTDSYYAHDDLTRRYQNVGDWEEPVNGHSHIAHMLMGGASHTIPVGAGRPLLGRWQRLMLVELDGARTRDVVLHVFGF
ncbi:MAG TPA: secondary thiamine-phosphate synthase enzyme YjbQ [Actinomycetota bacterium]|nr:secondary thiamine-phosphate synthase enzyme YjbQ [Actinomycetota bacterium]